MESVFFSLVVAIVSLSCLTNFASANPVKVTKLSAKVFFLPCPGVHTEGKLLSATFNATLGPNGKTAIIHKNTYAGIEFSFVSNKKVTGLTSRVSGKVDPLPFINFPLDNPNGCKDSGITCPFAAKTKQHIKTVLHLSSLIPSVGVFVKWELQNQDKKPIFCVIIPAKVES